MNVIVIIVGAILALLRPIHGEKLSAAETVGNFSGVYTPRGWEHLEHYAGACLLGLKRLIEAEHLLKNGNRLEDVGLSLCGGDLRNDKRQIAMTRDYFDFSVVHLSSTTNQLPHFDLRPAIMQQMKNMVKQQLSTSSTAEGSNSSGSDTRLRENTVALIPFSSISHSNTGSTAKEWEAEIRTHYFLATFYSVYVFCYTIVLPFFSCL
jgi:hypothetical protein